MVDSAEHYADFASRLGASGATVAALVARGWGTQSGLAYAVLRQEDVDTGILRPILGDPFSADADLVSGVAHPEASALRRLFFESYTAVMAGLKRRAENTDETAPRKLSRAEKAHMRSTFDARAIPGFKAKGRLDPSDHYLEKATQLLETEDWDLKLMDWERVTYQGAPLVRVPTTAANSSGFWRETVQQVPEDAVVSGAMSAYQLLHRRGIAWDMVGLCPFESHEDLIEFYWDKMERDPPRRTTSRSPSSRSGSQTTRS